MSCFLWKEDKYFIRTFTIHNYQFHYNSNERACEYVYFCFGFVALVFVCFFVCVVVIYFKIKKRAEDARGMEFVKMTRPIIQRKVFRNLESNWKKNYRCPIVHTVQLKIQTDNYETESYTFTVMRLSISLSIPKLPDVLPAKIPKDVPQDYTSEVMVLVKEAAGRENLNLEKLVKAR